LKEEGEREGTRDIQTWSREGMGIGSSCSETFVNLTFMMGQVYVQVSMCMVMGIR